MSATTFSSKPPWTGPQQSRRIGAAKPAKGRRGSGHILRDLARQALVHAAADAGVLRGTESSHDSPLEGLDSDFQYAGAIDLVVRAALSDLMGQLCAPLRDQNT